MASKLNRSAALSSSPTMSNDALSAEPEPLTFAYVNVSPASGSVVAKVPIGVPMAEFSGIEFADS